MLFRSVNIRNAKLIYPDCVVIQTETGFPLFLKHANPAALDDMPGAKSYKARDSYGKAYWVYATPEFMNAYLRTVGPLGRFKCGEILKMPISGNKRVYVIAMPSCSEPFNGLVVVGTQHWILANSKLGEIYGNANLMLERVLNIDDIRDEQTRALYLAYSDFIFKEQLYSCGEYIVKKEHQKIGRAHV